MIISTGAAVMKNGMPDIKTYYPLSPLLKKYVQYYYFMQSGDEAFNTSYFVFPNTNISLNIHRDVLPVIDNSRIDVAGINKNNRVAVLMGMREWPVLVNLKGHLDKVTIVFHPLGLNHFLKESYLQVASKPAQVFYSWDNDRSYQFFLEQFYATGDHNKRVTLLEELLLSMYHPLPAVEPLVKGIELLSDFSEDRTVAGIAKMTGMPERTFSRAFHRETGISPIKFKKIARFRHSMKNRLFSAQFRRLTEIAYASNFYDQAYFINMYRQLTHKNPTAFFRDINQLADDNLILSFIKTG